MSRDRKKIHESGFWRGRHYWCYLHFLGCGVETRAVKKSYFLISWLPRKSIFWNVFEVFYKTIFGYNFIDSKLFSAIPKPFCSAESQLQIGFWIIKNGFDSRKLWPKPVRYKKEIRKSFDFLISSQPWLKHVFPKVTHRRGRGEGITPTTFQVWCRLTNINFCGRSGQGNGRKGAGL